MTFLLYILNRCKCSMVDEKVDYTILIKTNRGPMNLDKTVGFFYNFIFSRSFNWVNLYVDSSSDRFDSESWDVSVQVVSVLVVSWPSWNSSLYRSNAILSQNSSNSQPTSANAWLSNSSHTLHTHACTHTNTRARTHARTHTFFSFLFIKQSNI